VTATTTNGNGETAAARRVEELQRQHAERAGRLAEIRAGLEILWTPGGVHEIRALKVRGRKMTAAGWFDDLGKAAEAALKLDEIGAAGIYLTANPCDPALLARGNNRIIEWAEQTTSDHEIGRRRLLPLDFDPQRRAGIPATEEEKQAADTLAQEAEEKLRARGWPYPLIMDSGNGCYRLFRIDLPNDKDTAELLRRVLVGIATLLGPQERDGEPYAALDLTMFNAARIIRLPGTTNRKGDGAPDRPHRRAVLCEPVDECPIDVVPLDLLQAVAELAPATGTTSRTVTPTSNGATFDIERWIADHAIPIERGPEPWQDGRRWILKVCQWNADHQDKSAFIVQHGDGRLGAGCKHNGCIGKGWHDLRDAVEPGWRERPKQNDTTKARPAARIEPGTKVRAMDRDNFGEVTADNGSTCTVHFVSPDGQHADNELSKSQLRTADGRPLDGDQADGPPRFITTLLTSGQLDDLNTEPRYIVKNAVPAGQVGAAGAKSKGCKTGIATDLIISTASATRFLNEFEIPEPVPVLDLCGESGASKIRRQARQICEARGLALRDLPIFWGFDLPKLCLPFHVDALADFIRQNKIALAIIDPLYLALFTAETAGRSGDLYTMGATFEPLTAVCRETGASILLVHHFRKNRGDDQQEPCSLEELSQAGLAEVARWWILLERREPYAGDGRHSLWLRVGGSEGHASFWGLEINEGLTVDSEGNQRTTKWETTLSRVQDTKAEEKRQREHRQALEMEKRDGEHVDKLVCALRKYPAGQTARQLRADSRLNGDNFLRAVQALKQAGRIEEISIAKQRGTYDGFKLKT
jgi:hypothetical protein